MLNDKQVQAWDNTVRPVLGYYGANELLNFLMDAAAGRKRVFRGMCPLSLLKSPLDAVRLFELKEIPKRNAALLMMSSDCIHVNDNTFIMLKEGA